MKGIVLGLSGCPGEPRPAPATSPRHIVVHSHPLPSVMQKRGNSRHNKSEQSKIFELVQQDVVTYEIEGLAV